ncbi:MAG: 5-oxoprolinase subunit PxpB [Rudaea sp.]
MNQLRIEALGDCALLIRFGETIDADINAGVLAACEVLQAANLPGVQDIAPAYASVCVRYEPNAWFDGEDTRLPYARIAERITQLVEDISQRSARVPTDIVEIPVCYGGEFGLDLDAVAVHAKLPTQTVIERHSAVEYQVAMLGFAPGFAYLLGLDSVLHTPRRADPRVRVPAGSVAIGGEQTGIYPRESPGGWNLLGCTPLTLFDPARNSPALLAPGQRVRFRAINAAEFRRLSS